MSNKLISKEEINKNRTPFELMDWVKQKRCHIASTQDGENDLLLKKKLAKQFVEEVYPLAIFGCHKFGNTKQILMRPIIGNQNYDAVITDLSSEPAYISYIEITQSLEGRSDKKMRCELAKQGIYQSKIFDGDEVAGKELSRIVEAAKRKEAKDYPKETSLIIVFDDGCNFRRFVNDEYLNTVVKENILKLDLRFSKLYLVGRYQDTFLEFDLGKRT